jgi:hypothetical protein
MKEANRKKKYCNRKKIGLEFNMLNEWYVYRNEKKNVHTY